MRFKAHWLIISFSFVILSFCVANVSAAAMDMESTSLLIKKFEKLYFQLPPGEETRIGITLRLADLLSERARYNSMQELESGCIQCVAGEKDRLKAVKYYKDVLPKIKDRQKAKVLAQLGHLYELLGEKSKAIELYNIIIDSNYSTEIQAEAHISLAEVYFKKHNYKLALKHYNWVLEKDGVGRESLAAYRKAWSLFNLNSVQEAVDQLVKILNTPKLLTRSFSGIIAVDDQYKGEVSRDLATFMAKNRAKLAEAKLLFQLSPEEVRLENVTYLANELERLGQSADAIAVYRFVIDNERLAHKRMSAYIHISMLEREENQNEASLVDYRQALALWEQMGKCTLMECTEWKSRLRKYVLDWNRVEKKSPSDLLMQAYASYSELFPDEIDMKIWAAQAYDLRKQPRKSLALYQWVTKVIAAKTAKPVVNSKVQLPVLESLLLTQVELAERINERPVLVDAYNRYLELSVEKKKVVEMRYQLAYLLYKDANYVDASVALKEVALSKEPGGDGLKKKAADLSLDALVLLKQDSKIEDWANEYAKVFVKSAAEFAKISRTSILNQVAALAKGSTDLFQSLAVLERFDLSSATEKEKISYYKNKLILCEKLNKYVDARVAANDLLTFKALSEEDRQFALSRKAWIAEMLLDFGTALNVTKNLQLPELRPDQKILKLALFAELAGRDSKTFYKQYLKQTKDQEKAYAISLKLVNEAKKPLAELKKHRRVLISKPEVFARLYLEQITLGFDEKVGLKAKEINYLVKDKVLRTTSSARFLRRYRFLVSLEKLSSLVKAHKLSYKTQRQLSRSLSARIKLIDKVEEQLNLAIKSQDWTSQLLAIDILAKESSRFYSEILSLPMPEGLGEQEQVQYMTLLSQQAAPHNIRATELRAKLKEFWEDRKFISAYQDQYNTSKSGVRRMIDLEISRIRSIAPEELKTSLVMDSPIVDTVVKPSFVEMEAARELVRKEPMNVSYLDSLLSLERKMGSQVMVSYLESRIERAKIQKETL